MITRRILLVVFSSLSLGGCYYFDFLRGDVSYPHEWPKRASHWFFSCLDLTGTYRDNADLKVYDGNIEPDKAIAASGPSLRMLFETYDLQYAFTQGGYVQINGPRDGRLRATHLIDKNNRAAMEREFVQSKNMECGWGGVTISRTFPLHGEIKEVKVKIRKNVDGGLVMESYFWDCFFPGNLWCEKRGGWYQWPRAQLKSSEPVIKSSNGQ